MSVVMSEQDIAVVIPFYQKKSGILQHAVQSVLEQTLVDRVRLIVVDDCSPVPASAELAAVLESHPDRVRVVQMAENSGQGVARNRGLDELSSDTEYVAFLDSDDRWSTDHLANAVAALDRGFDFYFSDFYQLHQTVSAFNRASRIRPDEHPALEGSVDLHEYRGDMFEQIIAGNVLGMSTTVYRFSKFPGLRFHEEFRSTGEEYLFWLDLARATDRIAFSSRIECHYGEGVNTYSGATWGSPNALRRAHDEIRYLRTIKKKYPVTAGQGRKLSATIQKLRTEFVREYIHRLAHRQGLELKIVASMVRLDPPLAVLALPLALRISAEAVFRKSKGAD
jgi:succinoglycan biosynthesis protein ExoW